MSVITFGEGTASSQMLEYLSLSDTKKDVVFSLIDSSDEKEILDLLNHHFHIKKNNHGIAFTIALTSINSLSLKQIMGNEGL